MNDPGCIEHDSCEHCSELITAENYGQRTAEGIICSDCCRFAQDQQQASPPPERGVIPAEAADEVYGYMGRFVNGEFQPAQDLGEAGA